MKISEITGSKLKRDLEAKRALKSYHNKHRDGSGNFGFVVVFDDPSGLAGERWFRIDGDYSSTGEITRLSAGPYAEAGHAVFPISYQQLIQVLKETGRTDSSGQKIVCKEGEIEVVLTKREWGGVIACAPLEQLKNPKSYHVTVRYMEAGREWSPSIPKHNIDVRRSSLEVRKILKETHPEWYKISEAAPSDSEVATPRIEKTDLTIEKLKEELRGFTGTVNYYRHFTGLKYTDGVKYLADRAGAHWLLDAVFSYQVKRRIRELPFQIWTLKVIRSELGKSKKEPMAVLEMREDTNAPVLVKQNIAYTDFPEGEIKLYYIDGVLLLPSEY